MSDTPAQKDQRHMQVQDFFSDVSKSDLKNMGLGDVAYVRRYILRGYKAFVLHAADGTALAVQSSEVAAKQNAYNEDLNLATVH